MPRSRAALLPTLLTGLAMTLFSAPSLAIDLKNEDAHARSVEVRSRAMVRTVDLAPRSVSIIICVGPCTFRLAGKRRTVEAAGDDVVAVRRGALAVVQGVPIPAVSRRALPPGPYVQRR